MARQVTHAWANLSYSGFGGSTGGLHKVFGLDSSSLLRSSPVRGPSRNLASLLRKGPNDAPAGLGNWDNSCYQNSVIQGLSSLPSLTPFLRDLLLRKHATSDESTNAALLEMVDKLHDDGNNGNYLWLPAKLKSMSTWQQQDAQEYFSKILDQVEKEASVVAKAPSSSSHGRLGFASILEDSENVPQSSREDSDEQSTPSHPPLRNPLEGMLAQRVACTRCGFSEGLSLIPFNCLTVQLGNAWTYDIRECLDEYTKLEFIEGVQCPKCTFIRLKLQLEKLLGSDGISDELKETMIQRLKAVESALENEDFADATIVKKCGVQKQNWTLSNKSRQAVVARAPQSLVIHVNRSCFNEMTGAQTKNYADVTFPMSLDLGQWCAGGDQRQLISEKTDQIKVDWPMNPVESMLPNSEKGAEELYQLRAVVTHHGRHENGHYICYRLHEVKQPAQSSDNEEDKTAGADDSRREERWWRLSDEDVTAVSEDIVLCQGEVFMLFYEKVNTIASVPVESSSIKESDIEKRTLQGHDIAAVSASDLDVLIDGPLSTTDPTIIAESNEHTPPFALPKHSTPQNDASALMSNGIEKDSSVTFTNIVDTSIAEAAVEPETPLDDSNLPSSSEQEGKEIDDTVIEKENSSQASSTQQQPPIIMRTAGITERHDSADGIDPTGLRMVAAT